MKRLLKNILVATDFSGAGNNVVNSAIELCKQHEAVMHLIHVKESRYILDNPEPGTVASSIISDIDHEARSRLYEIYESILREHNIAVQIHMPTGIPFDEICRSANEMPIDLIIVGMHGTSGGKSHIIGTTAYSVLKYAVKPVLLIPPGTAFTGFKNILFPIRASQEIGVKFKLLESGLANPDTHVHIGIFGLPKDAEKTPFRNDELAEIISIMNEAGMSSTTEFYTGKDLAEKILALTGLLPADLLIMNCALDYKFTQFCIGAYSREIISNAKIPVLSFRNCIDITEEKEEEEVKKDVKSGNLAAQVI